MRAGFGGLMFPQTTHRKPPGPMSQSMNNKRIKMVWSSYTQSVDDDEAPDVIFFCSSYIRRIWVSAIHHPSGDRDRKAQVASQMGHRVSTVEANNDTTGGLETTSKATQYFRDLMFGDLGTGVGKCNYSFCFD